MSAGSLLGILRHHQVNQNHTGTIDFTKHDLNPVNYYRSQKIPASRRVKVGICRVSSDRQCTDIFLLPRQSSQSLTVVIGIGNL